MMRCQACGHVVETARQTTQRVGSEAVTLDTCSNSDCNSARLVDDAARTGAVVHYPTEAAR